MFLGALTLGELRVLVEIDGVFSLGNKWLPICRSRSRKGMFYIYMESFGDPDVTIPLDSIVKVNGRIVRVDVDTSLIACGYLMDRKSTEVRIELNEYPFPETI